MDHDEGADGAAELRRALDAAFAPAAAGGVAADGFRPGDWFETRPDDRQLGRWACDIARQDGR